jgi:transposase-like protein
MAATSSIDLSGWVSEQLGQASPDLLRAMLASFVEALMGADADAVCGAPYGVCSEERANTRNGPAISRRLQIGRGPAHVGRPTQPTESRR